MIKKQFSKFTLLFLKTLAKLQLKKIKPLIIGVGGSSGKSSLSSLISITLAEKYNVHFNEGMNSETGIPLNILGIKMKTYSVFDWLRVLSIAPFCLLFNWKRYKFYIAEMGIDSPFEPKNMTYLQKIISPTIGVLTNISFEHSQYFDKLVEGNNEKLRKEKLLKLIADQELLLLKKIPRSGTAFLNIDDKKIAQSAKSIKAKKILISEKNKNTDFYIKNTIIALEKFTVNFINDGIEYTINVPSLLPVHYAKTIVFTIAVAKTCGISINDAIKIIEDNFSLPPGRMTVFNGIKNTQIIDSSYNNATLPPVLDLLEMLKTIGKRQRRLAILGDMRELGSFSKEAHEILADKILKTVDYVILIGPLMKKYISPVLKKNKFEHQSFLTFTEAKENILKEIKNDDLILVKGSQNTLYLERVVEMLLKNPQEKNKLCRRGEFWSKKRQLTP